MVGCTIKSKYPAIRPLDQEEVCGLQQLLQQTPENILAHLCSDLMQSGNFKAMEGGTVPFDRASEVLIHPIEVLSSKGPVGTLGVHEQGRARLMAALKDYGGKMVRRLRVLSDIEFCIIYADEKLSQYIGATRTPVTTVRQLTSACMRMQGWSAIFPS